MRRWIPGLLCSLSLLFVMPPVQAEVAPVPADAGERMLQGSAADTDGWGAQSTPFDSGADPDRFQEQDPWEGFNRKIFAFNEFFDRWIFKPAAKAYRWVTPQWADDTVSRVFRNVGDLSNGINQVLQWRWGNAGDSFARFGINSTLGLAGLFDVATDVGIEKHKTSLDMTLATWGVHAGPYLVLPILGPSSVRDAGSLYPSSYLWLPSYIEDSKVRLGVAGLYGVDLRADLLDLEKAIVGDRYTFIRNFYLQSHVFSTRDDGGLPPLPDKAPPEGDGGW